MYIYCTTFCYFINSILKEKFANHQKKREENTGGQELQHDCGIKLVLRNQHPVKLKPK